jgi:hypothetical protein
MTYHCGVVNNLLSLGIRELGPDCALRLKELNEGANRRVRIFAVDGLPLLNALLWRLDVGPLTGSQSGDSVWTTAMNNPPVAQFGVITFCQRCVWFEDTVYLKFLHVFVVCTPDLDPPLPTHDIFSIKSIP